MNHTDDRSRRRWGTAAILFAVTVYAGWVPITRLGVLSHLTPADVAALRYAMAGFLSLPVLLRRWRDVPWHRPWPLLAISVGAGVPYFLFFAYGMRLATSGQGAVLGPGAVSPIAVAIVWVFLHERPTKTQLIGLALTVGGVLAVLSHDILSKGGHLAGFALLLLASSCWATFTVVSRVLRMQPIVTAALVSVVNAIVYLPIYWLISAPGQLRAAAPFKLLALQAIYQGALTGVIALIAFSYAVERLGPAGTARFMPLVPVFATFFGWLMLNDHLDVGTVIGLSAVLVGVLIANRSPKL